ncbi:MAG: family 20 glycosylhydrolase [Alloprevotella sp.]|nr:family 20 glycosylhydrolase [Alloprevotella sp.]
MFKKRIFTLMATCAFIVSLSAQSAAYEWRGCMIDVSRHFFSVDFLKKQIDAFQDIGINKLHLHLTDAAGWRLEIKRYPLLTSKAAWRTQEDWNKWWVNNDRRYASEFTPGAYGGYYTQEQMRDLVAYAADRGVEIVPEIEMPGHSEEVLATYPKLACNGIFDGQGDLCPSNDLTVQFMQNVLDEVMSIFPSPYIHIGGDEASMAAWEKCASCSQRKAELGIKSNQELQDHFVREMMQYVISKGRKPIAWDEALCEGLPKGSVIMVWRGLEKAQHAVDLGYDVILSPSAYCYLDYYQDAPIVEPYAFGTYLPLEQTYLLKDALIDSPHVLGVQGNLWTEFIPTGAHAEYMLYPRIIAIAEIGKAGKEIEPFKEFRFNTLHTLNQLSQNGYNTFDLRTEQGHRSESLVDIVNRASKGRVIYNQPMNETYPASGENALIDGKRGDWNHNDKRWQGFKGKNCLDVTVDLRKAIEISSVGMDFMQSDVAWIYLPSELTIALSADGKTYNEVANFKIVKRPSNRLFFQNLGWTGKQKARYIHIVASSPTPDDWIFLDEILVK